MTAPLTGYETHGGWTTLAEEGALLAHVAADTSATYTVIGRSHLGSELRRLDIGDDAKSTVLIVGLQHGDEPAGREAALILARDLAYSTDPDTLAYLAEHRVVFLPSAVPDALPDRRNAPGTQDINQTHFVLSRFESRAIAQTIAATHPHLVIDLHEYERPVNDEEGQSMLLDVSQLQAQAPSITAMSQALHAHIVHEVEAQGHTTGGYGVGSLAVLRSVTAAYHAVGLLVESHRRRPLPERISMNMLVLRKSLTWHREHAAEFADMADASRAYSRTSDDPYILRTSATGSDATTLNISGYKITDPIPARLAPFGIQVDEYGFVPINQDARLAIPVLLDEASPYRTVAGIRVQRPPDPDPPAGSALRFTDGTRAVLRRTDGTPITL